jgi:Zinc finger, C3HC4 type (RING finger)
MSICKGAVIVFTSFGILAAYVGQVMFLHSAVFQENNVAELTYRWEHGLWDNRSYNNEYFAFLITTAMWTGIYCLVLSHLLNSLRVEVQIWREREFVFMPMPTATAATAAAPPEEEKTTCSICLDKDVTHLAIPCGHLRYCEECADNMTRTGRKICAVCNGAVLHYNIVYK